MDQGPRENEFRDQRIANMNRLAELGYKPWGQTFERSGRLAEIIAGFEEHKKVSIAGRMLTKRVMGKSIFAHLQDGSGRFLSSSRRTTGVC